MSACASSLRSPTRIGSGHPMIFVQSIRSGLRLPFSAILRSSAVRSFHLSCEKQSGHLDDLPVPGLSCGSLLTGRWFVRWPSDKPYMTLDPESDLMENMKLSTGGIVNGGKLLPMWWIRLGRCRREGNSRASRPLVRSFNREEIVEEPDLWTNPGASIGRRRWQPGL